MTCQTMTLRDITDDMMTPDDTDIRHAAPARWDSDQDNVIVAKLTPIYSASFVI